MKTKKTFSVMVTLLMLATVSTLVAGCGSSNDSTGSVSLKFQK